MEIDPSTELHPQPFLDFLFWRQDLLICQVAQAGLQLAILLPQPPLVLGLQALLDSISPLNILNSWWVEPMDWKNDCTLGLYPPFGLVGCLLPRQRGCWTGKEETCRLQLARREVSSAVADTGAPHLPSVSAHVHKTVCACVCVHTCLCGWVQACPYFPSALKAPFTHCIDPTRLLPLGEAINPSHRAVSLTASDKLMMALKSWDLKKGEVAWRTHWRPPERGRLAFGVIYKTRWGSNLLSTLCVRSEPLPAIDRWPAH